MSSWERKETILPGVFPGILLFVFLVMVLRTAWLCDDAYITYRTIDNFLNGHGLRWNIAERVQTYTHPLWMLALIPLHALTREVFYSTLLFSTAVSMLTAALLACRIARSYQGAVLGLLLCIFSTAFVEFSTSGLENPLSHLLAALFLMVYFREPTTPGRFALLVCIACLSAVNRHNLILLYLPMLLAEFMAMRSWRVAAWGALGLLPLIAWETFSVVYYGFLIPNTAYAKLGAGVPAMSLMAQGLRYLAHSLHHDLLTPAICAAALFYAFSARDSKSLGIAFSILLYLAYVVRIGGDFMSGRFLTTPFLLAVTLLIRAPRLTDRRCWLSAMIGACATGMIATHPPLLSGPRFGCDATPEMFLEGIQIRNERLFSYPALGLFSACDDQENISVAVFRGRENAGRLIRESDASVVQSTIAAGVGPYHAGPKVHFVDIMGICDPLLARWPIPDRNHWVIGHFRRNLPLGYLESVLSEDIQLEDEQLAAYYAHLRTITRDPIWSRRRSRTILNMHLGKYDPLIAHLWETE